MRRYLAHGPKMSFEFIASLILSQLVQTTVLSTRWLSLPLRLGFLGALNLKVG